MLFCGRYLEILIYEGWVKMMRMSMAEAERFPEQAAQCYDVAFTQVNVRIATYLQRTFRLSDQAGAHAARSDDVKSLKGAVLEWITDPTTGLVPPIPRNQMSGRGFHHEATGKYLCPAGLDWNDPRCAIIYIDVSALN